MLYNVQNSWPALVNIHTNSWYFAMRAQLIAEHPIKASLGHQKVSQHHSMHSFAVVEGEHTIFYLTTQHDIHFGWLGFRCCPHCP